MCYIPKLLILFCVSLFCINISHSCTNDKRPVLSLTGPVIRAVRNIRFLNQDGPLEMFCTGQEAERVKLNSESRTAITNLPTEIFNQTTVRYFVEKKEKQLTLYRCWEGVTACSSELFIVIDEKPDIRNLSCVSKNLAYLNCSWSSTNVAAIFHVYLTNKEPIRICKVVIKEVTTGLRYCSWDYFNYPSYLNERTLHLIVEGCSNFVCHNTTVDYDHLSIVKLDPPENLRVLKKTSHGVLLQWEIPYNTYKLLEGVEHRVEYRYPGIQPLEVNTSSVVSKLMRYQFELHLPCANQYYEVRVYVRPTQAVKEEYWSDFVSTSFVTDQIFEKEDNEGEAMCEKFDVNLTSEIMLYELNKLRTKVTEKLLQLKESVEELQEKAALINRQ